MAPRNEFFGLFCYAEHEDMANTEMMIDNSTRVRSVTE